MEYLPSVFSDLSTKDRFDIVKLFPAKLYDLDNLSPLHTNLLSGDQSNLFKLAMSTWRDSLDKVDITNQLSFDSLKSLRLSGNLLRSAFCLFGTKHLSPLNFHKLISNLGKLKDKQENVEIDFNIDEIQIRDVLNYFKTIKPYNDISAVDDIESIKIYIKKMSDESVSLINQSDISMREIHFVRKTTLRHLLHFYQLNVMDGKTEALPAYQHIKYLYDQFDFVRKSLLNLPEESKINIPPTLRNLTIETLKIYP